MFPQEFDQQTFTTDIAAFYTTAHNIIPKLTLIEQGLREVRSVHDQIILWQPAPHLLKHFARLTLEDTLTHEQQQRDVVTARSYAKLVKLLRYFNKVHLQANSVGMAYGRLKREYGKFENLELEVMWVLGDVRLHILEMMRLHDVILSLRSDEISRSWQPGEQEGNYVFSRGG